MAAAVEEDGNYDEDDHECSVRKLASVQVVQSVFPIAGADLIELIRVLGWMVVAPKAHNWKPGDLCVFFEIDSVVCPISAFSLLEQANYCVRTKKFRGQISQGFILPLSILDDESVQQYSAETFPPFDKEIAKPTADVGVDCTNWLRVYKAENIRYFLRYGTLNAPASRSTVKSFPHFIPKTDEVRVQTIPEVLERARGQTVYVTEKLDGTSCTLYVFEGAFGACSRNLLVARPPDTEKRNLMWNVIKSLHLDEKLLSLQRNIAVQGELVGPSIQGNKLAQNTHKLFLFRAFNIDSQEYVSLEELESITQTLKLSTVPILDRALVLGHTVDQLVEMALGTTALRPEAKGKGPSTREGIVCVFHSHEFGLRSFKVISPQFLLKHSE